jgi:hypothetical protein
MKMPVPSTILILILVTVTQLCAQTTAPFAGKWKVVTVNNGVIYDFKKNNVTVTPEFANSLTGNPDSALGIQVFTAKARMYENYYFIFQKDWIYREVMNGITRNEVASYNYHTEESIIYINAASDSPAEQQSMKYLMNKDGTLDLTISYKDKTMILTLEKAD